MLYLRSALNIKAWIIFFLAFVFSTALVPDIPAQQGQFPNELVGYEFFEKGKLVPVIFGQTKRSDIVAIFGNDCADSCEYDERFTIKFDYLSCDDCMTTEQIRDRAMCPLKEYLDTIEKITFTPKVSIWFDRVPTSRFPKRTGGSIWFKDGSGGVSYESFGDEFGLKYSIKQSSTSKLTLTFPAPAFMEGELYSIEYELTTELQTKIFKAEYDTCRKPAQSN
jgi:hypothetical protein